MEQHSALKAVAFSACLAGLAACSSGSDSNDSGTGSSNQLPIVDAGAPQTVNEFDNVALNGTASDGNGDALTYQWEQESGAASVPGSLREFVSKTRILWQNRWTREGRWSNLTECLYRTLEVAER